MEEQQQQRSLQQQQRQAQQQERGVQQQQGVVQQQQGGVVWSNGASNWTEEENVGSCKLLSIAAIAELSKDDTLKLWAQYYRDVLATPDSTDHINIRTFMAQGWDGVKFDNGIGLTKKASTDGWDWDSESFIP